MVLRRTARPARRSEADAPCPKPAAPADELDSCEPKASVEAIDMAARTAGTVRAGLPPAAPDRLRQSAAGLRRDPVHQAAPLAASTTCATSTTASTPSRAAGCYVLTDPFGPEPQVTRRAGRLGRRARPAARARSSTGGSFLSPDLSYDGQADRLRLRRVPGRHGAPPPHRPQPRPLGRGPLLPHLHGQRRRLAAWSS